MRYLADRALPGSIYLLSGLLGLLAFAYPFWQVTAGVTVTATPLLSLGLLSLCLLVLLLEVQGQAVSAKTVAVMGLLIAVSASLRFLEQVLPGPGGFSPIFVPLILTGYVFGARFGFLLGALTLLVSALATGGVGPWLPYQMFAAGWLGMSAGWLPRPRQVWLEQALLMAFGVVWGFLYGAVLNIYFWPSFIGDPAQSFPAGASMGAVLANYGRFYLVSSLVWDSLRALGNALLILAIGRPVLRALRRFERRFQFERRPVVETRPGAAEVL